MTKIFLIILNYNGGKFILTCLESLRIIRSENFDLSVLVIDNASMDNSVSLIRKKYPKINIIKNRENLGFAEGNNVGIRYALNNGADLVILLNNDTIASTDFIKGLTEIFHKDKKIGIASPKIYFAPGREYHPLRYKLHEQGKVIWYAGGKMDWDNILPRHRGVDEVDNGQYQDIIETDFATGCAMAVKREVFKKIGFLDKKYFLYFEDTDFCQRAKLKGFRCVYSPLSYLWHANAAVTGGSGSNLHRYYQTRNRYLFGFSYGSWRTRFALIREIFRNIFSKEEVIRKATGDFIFGKFGKYQGKSFLIK